MCIELLQRRKETRILPLRLKHTCTVFVWSLDGSIAVVLASFPFSTPASLPPFFSRFLGANALSASWPAMAENSLPKWKAELEARRAKEAAEREAAVQAAAQAAWIDNLIDDAQPVWKKELERRRSMAPDHDGAGGAGASPPKAAPSSNTVFSAPLGGSAKAPAAAAAAPSDGE